jgi:GNAT superfamily N-acetyltransferase
MWQVFREHHYLNTEKLGAGIRCYVAKYNGKPIAFIAIAHTHMGVRYYRVSRLVVLPDYQGIGVGKWLLNFMAQYFREFGLPIPFTILTSNPQLVRGLKGWKVKRFGHGSTPKSFRKTRINRELRRTNCYQRLTVSLEYVGAPKS